MAAVFKHLKVIWNRRGNTLTDEGFFKYKPSWKGLVHNDVILNVFLLVEGEIVFSFLVM
jgi:hypothetical protein